MVVEFPLIGLLGPSGRYERGEGRERVGEGGEGREEGHETKGREKREGLH